MNELVSQEDFSISAETFGAKSALFAYPHLSKLIQSKSIRTIYAKLKYQEFGKEIEDHTFVMDFCSHENRTPYW